ncbi:hypothetical protein QQ008_24795 [Fulvivirgaceae bacterium BMA10]|uniref:Uncharacterized protein n=1 Tax=Splendidivirga corallicola TaxID=3051826 RepID=A0ABT8KYE7_9BACT|nr:hypothetical protein [Fulvivirgaceae bacterium BMA10]
MISNLVEEAREIYRPEQVRMLFIAEAPPANSDRFFYFPDVRTGDSLFLHVIRAVFPELNEVETKQIRAMKEELLHRFREAGCFLEDSSLKSIAKEVGHGEKIRLLRIEQEALHQRIQRYKSTSKIVLVGATVFKANCEFLTGLGYSILNKSAIPFPGSGQQNRFKKAMRDIGF